MAIRKRAFIMLVMLVVISVYLTAYTVAVYALCSKYVVEQSGKAYWSNGPAGSLFPWPVKNGGIGIPMLFELNSIDLLIYNYLIKTYLLIILCGVFWFFAVALLYKQVTLSFNELTVKSE